MGRIGRGKDFQVSGQEVFALTETKSCLIFSAVDDSLNGLALGLGHGHVVVSPVRLTDLRKERPFAKT